MLWINLDIVWSAWSKDIQLYHRKGLWWGGGGGCWRVKRSLRHLQQRYKYICTNAMNNVITHIYIQVISFHSVHGRLRHLNNHQDRSGCSVNYFEICLEFRVFLHIISNTSSTHINKSSTQWNTTPPQISIWLQEIIWGRGRWRIIQSEPFMKSRNLEILKAFMSTYS